MAEGTSKKMGREMLFRWIQDQDREKPVRKIVDFGCGGGEQGTFMRKHLRNLDCLIGVDIWPPTIRSRMNDDPPLYDQVVMADFRGLLTGELEVCMDADLWFFGDCLEHVTEEEAFAIMNADGARLIAARIPAGPFPQGTGADGNTAEKHVWTFYPDMLTQITRRPVIDCLTAASTRYVNKYKAPQYIRGMGGRSTLKLHPKRYIANILIGPVK